MPSYIFALCAESCECERAQNGVCILIEFVDLFGNASLSHFTFRNFAKTFSFPLLVLLVLYFIMFFLEGIYEVLNITFDILINILMSS